MVFKYNIFYTGYTGYTGYSDYTGYSGYTHQLLPNTSNFEPFL